jgi:hypothetical protein
MKADPIIIDPVKPISKKKTEKLVSRDVILQNLLDISARDKTSAIVSKHYFHEVLLNDEPDEEEKKDDETSSSSQPATQLTQPSTKSSSASNGSLRKKALALPVNSGNESAAVSSIQDKTLSPVGATSLKPSAHEPPPSTFTQDLTRSPPASETLEEDIAAKPPPKTAPAADPKKETPAAKRELVMLQEEKKKSNETPAPWRSTRKRSRPDHANTVATGAEEPFVIKKRSRSQDGETIPAPKTRKMTAAKTIVKQKNRK